MFKKNKEDSNSIRVSSKTDARSLAGSIAKALEKHDTVEIQSIGAGATNQAVKGIAIARGMIATSGKDVICRQGIGDVNVNGEIKSAIKQYVTIQ